MGDLTFLLGFVLWSFWGVVKGIRMRRETGKMPGLWGAVLVALLGCAAGVYSFFR